ncbi:MAG: TRAP transporter small permease [Alphaproteobacteria bacterium]|nr:MAG: TRAP transporter small permease [Alphaproteobacteria bacterium]
MRRLARVIDAVSEAGGRLSAWIFFAIGLSITFEVVMRYVFTAPTIWVDEISRILQVWAAYLAAAYVLKHRAMVTIEVFFEDPTTLRRRLAETLGLVMLFLFAGVAVYYGFGLWLKATLAGHTTDSFLAPPKWFTEASIWVGFGLLFLQGLVELWRIWTEGIPLDDDDPAAGTH